MKIKLMDRKSYDKWVAGMKPGECTFCDWKHNQIVLKEGWRWMWIANIAPYWYWHTMLVPKRHITKMEEINDYEWMELKEMHTYAMNKYRNAKLTRIDGSDVDRYVFFWRQRDNPIDPQTGAFKPNHFHIHMAPDKDRLWDSILDKDAYKLDIVSKLK